MYVQNETSINNFIPHGHSFYWKMDILYPFVLGEFLTALSFLIISVVLLFLIYRSFITDLMRPIASIYALFIFLNCTTHILNIVNVWYGLYELSSATSIITGIVSLIAAIATIHIAKLHSRYTARINYLENKVEEYKSKWRSFKDSNQ